MNKPQNSLAALGTLAALRFDNSFVKSLPADPLDENYCRQVTAACYSRVRPLPQPRAALVAFSREMAMSLGLNPSECLSPRFTEVFSGTRLLPGMQPYAACYGGHQFGNWAGQLGDGRAINLGEVINPAGQRWSLQLKGAGPTPYSRNADGFAVLRSSVREFLCSEAMFHLRVPTTRALCLLTTGTRVERDMFYDGNFKIEPGAIVCRAAPSFIRFGNFEIFAARQEHEVLKSLLDYTLRTYYPHLGQPGKESYIQWFNEVCLSTARMITEWMRVGFVHGVMNTDNMSIHGLTLDYGPYGWLEAYDPYWTPNTTDAGGRRYAFGEQPQIAQWNLLKLANAIYPLVKDAAPLEDALSRYKHVYETAWNDMMSSKLGLLAYRAESDLLLFQDLIRNLKNIETDMTIFFRRLADLEIDAQSDAETMLALVQEAFYQNDICERDKPALLDWLVRYRQRLQQEQRPDETRRRQMNAVNPHYVLRNYLAQEAIEKAEAGDYSMIQELMEVLKNPYQQQAGKEHLAAKRPPWAKHKAGASMLSCSS